MKFFFKKFKFSLFLVIFKRTSYEKHLTLTLTLQNGNGFIFFNNIDENINKKRKKLYFLILYI